MEIFKKDSKYSLDGVFDKHDEFSKNKKWGGSAFGNTASTGSYGQEPETVVPIGARHNIVKTRSKLAIVSSQSSQERTRSFGIKALFVAFIFIVFAFYLDYIFGIMSLLFFGYVAMTASLSFGQHPNFDKELNLFWVGPNREKVKSVERSGKCKFVTDLNDIKSIKLKKVRITHQDSSSAEFYAVFNSLRDGSDRQFFMNKEHDICKLVANEVAKFLSVNVEEDSAVVERQFYSQDLQEAHEKIEQEKK